MTIEGSETEGGRRIRLGMIGGGQGAFIGAVHRIAARLDNHYELVAGALSGEPARARASGLELGLAEERAYASWQELLAGEAARPDGMEVVAIVTPNHLHHAPAKAALEAGFHVICDKPLAISLEQAQDLAETVARTGRLFCLTHNYTGYPLVRQARAMVQAGLLGRIRLVQMEYPQDWLTERLEASGQKQAAWRTDPARSGAGGCIGDIGTHAYNLGAFVSGLETEALLAELTTFVEGRALDDNVQVLLRYKGGARGMLWASQVAPGNENALKLRVYGETGGLSWSQEEPNRLWHSLFGEPTRLITRGGAGSDASAGRMTRIPPGHPEGYLEGFANIYAEMAAAIRAARSGGPLDPAVTFPGIAEGVAGMAFIAAAVRSSAAGGTWIQL